MRLGEVGSTWPNGEIPRIGRRWVCQYEEAAKMMVVSFPTPGDNSAALGQTF